MDELEAVQYAKNILWFAEHDERTETDTVAIQIQILRALLAMATRPHD
jgi:hypothetical protein